MSYRNESNNTQEGQNSEYKIKDGKISAGPLHKFYTLKRDMG